MARVLLVEDERKLAGFVRRGLEEEGHRVDLAFDGRDGLEMARIGRYDLVILDLMLPEVEGLRICRILRQEGCNVPILVLTALGAVEDRVEGLDAGADDYLVKPFSLAELAARVRALLRRPPSEAPSALRAGDLEMDPCRREVRRGGRLLQLTPREWSLLEYLLRNRGRVVTRTMIAEAVWGYDFEGFSNVVDVYISHLRRKVDRGFSRRLIHTVRGVGYILEENGRYSIFR